MWLEYDKVVTRDFACEIWEKWGGWKKKTNWEIRGGGGKCFVDLSDMMFRRQNVDSLVTDLWEGDDDNSLERKIYFKRN